MLNLINTFDSITDAIKETGIKTIWDCCSGRSRSAGGFIWKYKQSKK